MRMFHRKISNGQDPELTALLREIYRAPAGAAYWSGLETRVMTRITGAAPAPEWWQAFAGWTRLGLVTAGLVGVAAGLVLLHARGAEARIAYEAAIETPPILPGAKAARTPGMSEHEATLRYVAAY